DDAWHRAARRGRAVRGLRDLAGKRLHERPRSVRPGAWVEALTRRDARLHGGGRSHGVRDAPRRGDPLMQIWAALFSGIVFGAGLFVSGMSNPAKVLGFLDFAGAWDPSLAFVMGGALAVNAAAFAATRRRARPLFAGSFALPTRQDIDRELLTGSVLFGIGWGLVGLCPGPALASLLRGELPVYRFVAAMAVGMLFARLRQLLYTSE